MTGLTERFLLLPTIMLSVDCLFVRDPVRAARRRGHFFLYSATVLSQLKVSMLERWQSDWNGPGVFAATFTSFLIRSGRT